MRKLIRVNRSFIDFMNPNLGFVDNDFVQTFKESPIEITATVNKADLAAFFEREGGNGIRFYPAMNDNKLIMVAVATQGFDDLIGPNRYCLVCNEDGPVQVEGMQQIGGISMLPTDSAKSLIDGEGSESSMVDMLKQIRQTNLSRYGLKVLFDQDFILNKNQDFTLERDYDNILFEVVDLKMNDMEETKRSMHCTFRNQNENVYNAISMLPCPPHCGDVYANSSVTIA